MKNLQAYVDRKNSWSKLFGEKPLVIGKDNQKIADALDCDMSPENISCDGERPLSQVRQLRAFYTAAGRELLRLDPTVKMYEVEGWL